VGEPVFWGESQEGQLGCPNPSANLIGVHQAFSVPLGIYTLFIVEKYQKNQHILRGNML